MKKKLENTSSKKNRIYLTQKSPGTLVPTHSQYRAILTSAKTKVRAWSKSSYLEKADMSLCGVSDKNHV